jgi:hypothetical protein
MTFVGYRESHMEIYSEEQEASKDDCTDPSSSIVHPSDYQEESVEPTEPMDLPIDVAMTRKRSAWLRDTLQMLRAMQLPMVLSGSANDLRGSRVIWH